jgi:drug/metabolite transporter (DMT)-like permease
MKLYLLFIVGAIIAWGAYVPMLHQGQTLLKNGALRGFLCVGVAYFVTAVLLPLALMGAGMEPWQWNSGGVAYSTIAGVFGAAGALCIILAIKAGGTPFVVAPLVFAGAPLVNTLVSMTWHKPKAPPEPWYYVGLALAAAGVFLVLRFKPT